MKCAWKHCLNDSGEKICCSKKCKNKFYVDARRKKLKVMAIEYKGGKCTLCGYFKCIEALEFHHLDRSEKSFGIANKGYTRSWNKVKEELDKCILVCSNCHHELEIV